MSDPVSYYVSLDNNYAYKAYCHSKSIEAFEKAMTKELYPSRYNLLFSSLYDTLATPFLVVKKVYNIVLYVWNLTYLKEQEGNAFRFYHIPSIIGLTGFQLPISPGGVHRLEFFLLFLGLPDS